MMIKTSIDRLTFLKKIYDIVEIKKLDGDASDRIYYRIVIRGGKSIIAQVYCDKNDLLFDAQHNSSKFLKKNGISIPGIELMFKKERVIVFEDVGDMSLYRYLTDGGDIKKYQPQIENLLVKFGDLPYKKYDSPYPPVDFKKYMWGFHFFEKYFLKMDIKIKLSASDKKELHNEFEDISTYLSKNYFSLIHRDFHSKNIFIKDENIYIIDYQDLRLGDPFYDRTSFLWDVYFDYGDDRKLFFPSIDRYIYRIYLLAIQRLFKILGNFSYLKIEKNKPSYIENYRSMIINYLHDLLSLVGYKALYNVYEIIKEKTNGS